MKTNGTVTSYQPTHITEALKPTRSIDYKTEKITNWRHPFLIHHRTIEGSDITLHLHSSPASVPCTDPALSTPAAVQTVTMNHKL